MFQSYDPGFWVVREDDKVKLNIKNDKDAREKWSIEDCIDMIKMVFDHVFGKSVDGLMIFQSMYKVGPEQHVTQHNDPSGQVLQQTIQNLQRWKKWYSEDAEDVKYHQQFQADLVDCLSRIGVDE